MSAQKQLETQSEAVKAALKELGRAKAGHEKAFVREEKAHARYEVAKARVKDGGQKHASKRAATTAWRRAKEASTLRREAAAKVKEAKKLLREQEKLSREALRKEHAKQRAISAFVKKWEREYDLAMKMKKKNIELRKKAIRRD